MSSWFSATESVRFGEELATFLLSELAVATSKGQVKFAAKAERVLMRADQRLQGFKARERMNVYKKARLANAFLWTLRERNFPSEGANQLADWLSARI